MVNHVARLSHIIQWYHGWPGPYLLSKIIRSIVCPVRKGCLATHQALCDFCRFMWTIFCVCSHAGTANGNIESEEGERCDEMEKVEEGSLENPAERARNEFRISLQTTFSNVDRVDNIMDSIKYWEVGK